MLKYICFLILIVRIHSHLTHNQLHTTYDSNTNFVFNQALSTDYHLYWNFTDKDITLKVVVNTTGWIGFGLSSMGSMYNSDILLAWTNLNGVIEFKDAHIERSREVMVDTIQNWKIKYYSKSNGQTTMIFTRDLIICNTKLAENEVNIDIQTQVHIIFAYGNDYTSDDGFPAYHGNTRGSKLVRLLGSLNKQAETDYSSEVIETLDFRVNVSLSNDQKTTYYCEVFKLPDDFMTTKRHLIRYETLQNPNNIKYVHHWLVYECNDLALQMLYPDPTSQIRPGECLTNTYMDNMDLWNSLGLCRRISFAWAFGGDLSVEMPNSMAYPLGGSSPGAFRHFIFQIHYENNAMDANVVDQTGIRLYMTKDYRPIEFGLLTVGSATTFKSLDIPPKMKHMNVESKCNKDSLNNLFTNGNDYVTIISQNPHTHLAGRELYSKIIRNNTEVEYIANNKYYDFSQQYINYLPKPVRLYKGDEILVSCVYNTEDRSQFTFSGLGTKQEMCLNFIVYHPKSDAIFECQNDIAVDEWLRFYAILNSTGDIAWNWDGIPNENAFISAYQAMLTSPKLIGDAEYFEKLYQDFYNTVPRDLLLNAMPLNQKEYINVTRMAPMCSYATRLISSTFNILIFFMTNHFLKALVNFL